MAGQVHDGFCTHRHCGADLFHLHIIVLAVPGDSQVYIDLGAEHRTDSLGIQAGVQAVCGNGDLALCHQWHELLRAHLLLPGNNLQFRGEDAAAGGIHLCGIVSIHVAVSFFSCILLIENTLVMAPWGQAAAQSPQRMHSAWLGVLNTSTSILHARLHAPQAVHRPESTCRRQMEILLHSP